MKNTTVTMIAVLLALSLPRKGELAMKTTLNRLLRFDSNHEGFESMVCSRLLATAFLLSALLFPLVGHIPTAYAQSAPINVTEDFTLTSNITFAGAGFIVGADDITIDLDGHTITGSFLVCSPCPLEAGVLVDGHTGVTIKDGTISGFVFGIALFNNAHNNQIEKIETTSSTLHGIIIDEDSDNNELKKCTSSNNGGFGLLIDDDSDNNKVVDCEFTGNGRTGIVIRGSNNNIVKDNTVSENEEHGILIREDSDNNHVKKNTVNENGEHGIFINRDSDNNHVKKNTVNENGENGIFINRDSDNNHVKKNTVNENEKHGIRIHRDSDNNDVRDNVVNDNVENGIFVSFVDVQPADNLIKGNTLSGHTSDNFDIRDDTIDSGTAGTRNTYKDNECTLSSPLGLC